MKLRKRILAFKSRIGDLLFGDKPLKTRRIESALLTAALVLLFSILFGRFLIVPYLKYLPTQAAWILSGLALFSFAVNLESIWLRVFSNHVYACMMRKDFPQSASEVRDYGVETPVDYAYMMQLRLKYEPSPLFGFLVTHDECSDNRWLLTRSVELFEELFGRKPYGVELGDWNRIAVLETAAQLGKEESEISYEVFEEAVSRKVYDNVMEEAFGAFVRHNCKW